jgi:hypothetical protein
MSRREAKEDGLRRTPHEKAHWRGLMQKRLPTIRAYEGKVTRLLFDAQGAGLGEAESERREYRDSGDSVLTRGRKDGRWGQHPCQGD